MESRFLYYLSPILKFLIYVLFLVMWAVPFVLVVQLDFFDLDSDSLAGQFFNESALILIIFGALLMIFKVLNHIGFEQVYLVRKNFLSGFLKGSLIGFLLILCCVCLAYFNGNVVFSSININFMLVLLYAILYVLVAIAEELLFRSFPLFVFSERYPILIAVLINSVLFGLAHLGNPDFTAMAMLNITLAGLLFSIIILQKRNISWSIGIHFAWNFTQGVLLGYKVSGTDSPGLVTAKPIGPVYLSGGQFGIESSIFCTALLVLTISLVLIRYKMKLVKVVPGAEELKIDNGG